MEENDKFASHDDRQYTQGLRLSFPVKSRNPFWLLDQPYGLLSDNLPIFSGPDRKRKYEWTILGQSIFTPAKHID